MREKKQFESLHNYINQTYYEINEIENRVQMLYTVNDVHYAAITLTLILNNLERIKEMLFNALSDIFKGHLDTQIISTFRHANTIFIHKRCTTRYSGHIRSDLRQSLNYKQLFTI